MRVATGRRKGAVMILGILLASIFLGVLMTALYGTALQSLGGSAQGVSERQARYAAYAGIQRSLFELNKDPDWRLGWSQPQPLQQNPQLAYTVDADDTPPELGANEVYLFAQGYLEDGQTQKAVAAFSGTAFRPEKSFAEAAFGFGEMSLATTSTNAYDSSAGMYTEDKLAANAAGSGGHVGSTTKVRLSTGTTVDGDAILAKEAISSAVPGQSAPPSAVLENLGGGTLTGATVQPPEARSRPTFDNPYKETSDVEITNVDTLLPKDPPPGTIPTLAPGCIKSLSVGAGKTIKLASGDHYITDSLTLEGATLLTEGEVRLFVGKQMSVTNSVVNPLGLDKNGKPVNDRRPKDLVVFFLDELVDPDTEERSSLLNVSGGFLNCCFLGSRLQASVDSTEFLGAIVGDNVDISSSKIHYDKSLETIDLRQYAGWKLKGLKAMPPR